MEDLVLKSDSYMSKLDDIELKYNIFLAENEMNKKILQLGSGVLFENTSLYIINESVKDWIITFATKIAQAVSKAYNKLKTIFGEGKDLAYLRAIKNKVENMTENPNFVITDHFREYNKDRYKSFSIKEFDYNTMKDSLDSEKHFLSTNYAELGFNDQNTNIKEVCNNYFIGTKSNVTCTVDMIKEYFNWCYNEYIEELKAIENNMKKYNDSNKNIESFANNAINQAEPTNSNNNQPNNTTEVNAACIMYGDCFVKEAEGDNNSTNGKMSFQDTGVNPNNDGNNTTGNTITDQVKVFLTATTSILSSLFIIIKNQKADYITILKHCFPIGKNKENNGDNAEQQNNSQIPEVK